MDATIWDQVLTRIESKVNRHSFYTWFKPTSFVADGGAAITVRVPNPLFKDWLTKHYSVVLSEALAEVRRPGASVVFVTDGAPAPAVIPEPEVEPIAPVEAAEESRRPLPRRSATRLHAALPRAPRRARQSSAW